MAREGTFCDRLAHLMSLFMLVRQAGLRQDRKCSVQDTLSVITVTGALTTLGHLHISPALRR